MTAWEDLTRIEQLQCIYWDLYKDVYGFRPRHFNTDGMTEAELVSELDALQAEGERVWEAEKVRQAENLAKVESRIEALIGMGASDRATALRWIMDAEGANGDAEYLCYLLDIPYGSFNNVVFLQQPLESA